eukprot:SAG11_NODE_5020_length_1689_cov_2.012579_3_plen_114_part_00
MLARRHMGQPPEARHGAKRCWHPPSPAISAVRWRSTLTLALHVPNASFQNRRCRLCRTVYLVARYSAVCVALRCARDSWLVQHTGGSNHQSLESEEDADGCGGATVPLHCQAP